MSDLSLAPSKPLKFTDIRPGSQIRVTDITGTTDPYEAMVLEMKPEHGSNRIPALVVQRAGEVFIIPASGRWRAEVLLDSKILASAEPPTHLVRYRGRPVEISGIQFKGGMESATEIIRWAGGKAAISWRQADQEHSEALLVHTLEGVMEASIGDIVVEGTASEFYPVKPAIMAVKYEVVDEPKVAPKAD